MNIKIVAELIIIAALMTGYVVLRVRNSKKNK